MELTFFIGHDEDGHPFLIRIEHTLFAVKQLLKKNTLFSDMVYNEGYEIDKLTEETLGEIFNQRGGPSLITITI